MSAMNNKVSKSGDTMTGDLKLEKNCKVLVVDNNFDITANPTSTQKYYPLGIKETKKYNDFVTYMRYFYETDGSSTTSLISVCETTNGKRNGQGIDIHSKKDGTGYVICPASNVNNSIVTTISHGSNYVRFGNGLQICWGNSPVNQTITFQQPFKDAGYKVAFCQTTNAEHNINNTVVDKTTTSFKFNRGYQGDWIAIGYWY